MEQNGGVLFGEIHSSLSKIERQATEKHVWNWLFQLLHALRGVKLSDESLWGGIEIPLLKIFNLNRH